ncbi:hypothetical protein EYF80_054359 [Liparis tanakae]|uniref:Uncharacterized protein n=1 Tax=Liparis tanakae TaxID=230148 RepID=A0A4Z2F350_9TELE|nr:hypothetical protein EYF80_054359 [Liparis tanakae]
MDTHGTLGWRRRRRMKRKRKIKMEHTKARKQVKTSPNETLLSHVWRTLIQIHVDSFVSPKIHVRGKRSALFPAASLAVHAGRRLKPV